MVGIARSQVHADSVGLRCGRRAITIHRDKPEQSKLGLEKAHWGLRISPEEFDAVAAELARTLDYYGVPEREKGEVLAAFEAHKEEVNAGYFAAKR